MFDPQIYLQYKNLNFCDNLRFNKVLKNINEILRFNFESEFYAIDLETAVSL